MRSSTDLWYYSSYVNGTMMNEALDPPGRLLHPVRIMESDADGYHYEQPMLTGLLLLSRGQQKGQYRRVGRFELSEHWIRGENESSIWKRRVYWTIGFLCRAATMKSILSAWSEYWKLG